MKTPGRISRYLPHPARAGVLLWCAAAALFTALPARADSHLSGTYSCTKVEIGDKTVPCTAPAIQLKSDGSYKILSEQGTYEIREGHWLILSTSKNRGRARLDGVESIVFDFVSNGRKSRITYKRKFQRIPGNFET